MADALIDKAISTIAEMLIKELMNGAAQGSLILNKSSEACDELSAYTDAPAGVRRFLVQGILARLRARLGEHVHVREVVGKTYPNGEPAWGIQVVLAPAAAIADVRAGDSQ
jgi:hypothetical protein